MPTDSCSSQEYVNGDNDIPVCQDMDSEAWEEDFLLQLGKEDEEEEEEVEDSMQSEPTLATKVKSFKDAILVLEDVQTFLEDRGHVNTSLTFIGPAVDAVASIQVAVVKQGTLSD